MKHDILRTWTKRTKDNKVVKCANIISKAYVMHMRDEVLKRNKVYIAAGVDDSIEVYQATFEEVIECMILGTETVLPTKVYTNISKYIELVLKKEGVYRFVMKHKREVYEVSKELFNRRIKYIESIEFVKND